MTESLAAAKRSYRLRSPRSTTGDQRIKVGLYLLPSLYQKVKEVAARRNQPIYQTVEDCLTDGLETYERTFAQTSQEIE